MVNIPSQPEIITVNSEELQTLIRDLLPSQNGFGSELQASNVITPIIDLTATAEGSTLRQDLQEALNFGGATVFFSANNTVDLATSPGFYRVTGTSVIMATGLATALQQTDGSTTKTLWRHRHPTVAGVTSEQYDLIFWCSTGITLQATTSGASASLQGSIRQVADSEGAFVNPSGFPL